MKNYYGYSTEEQIDLICKDVAECLKNQYRIDGHGYVFDMLTFLKKLLIGIEVNQTICKLLHDKDEEES